MDRALRFQREKPINASYRVAKRGVIFVIGVTVLLLGGAMMVLPGPGIAMVLLGLAILAIEFAWARHWLNKIKSTAGNAQKGLSDWGTRAGWLRKGKRNELTQADSAYPKPERDR